MAEKYRFFDSIDGEDERFYSADEFAEYFRQVISSGILSGGTNLKVTSTGTDMNILINEGYAWLEGYLYKVDIEALEIKLDSADVTNDRIDRIIIRLDRTLENRYVKAFILRGESGVSPAPIELTRDENIYEISLAQVRVVAGKSFIANKDITDERLDNNVCGLANSLATADTTDIFNQFQDWYNSRTREWKADWNQWWTLNPEKYESDWRDFTADREAWRIASEARFEEWFADQKTEGFIMANREGQPNGIATLDELGIVNENQLPIDTSPHKSFYEVGEGITTKKDELYAVVDGKLTKPKNELIYINKQPFPLNEAEKQRVFQLRDGSFLIVKSTEITDVKKLFIAKYELEQGLWKQTKYVEYNYKTASYEFSQYTVRIQELEDGRIILVASHFRSGYTNTDGTVAVLIDTNGENIVIKDEKKIRPMMQAKQTYLFKKDNNNIVVLVIDGAKHFYWNVKIDENDIITLSSGKQENVTASGNYWLDDTSKNNPVIKLSPTRFIVYSFEYRRIRSLVVNIISETKMTFSYGEVLSMASDEQMFSPYFNGNKIIIPTKDGCVGMAVNSNGLTKVNMHKDKKYTYWHPMSGNIKGNWWCISDKQGNKEKLEIIVSENGVITTKSPGTRIEVSGEEEPADRPQAYEYFKTMELENGNLMYMEFGQEHFYEVGDALILEDTVLAIEDGKTSGELCNCFERESVIKLKESTINSQSLTLGDVYYMSGEEQYISKEMVTIKDRRLGEYKGNGLFDPFYRKKKFFNINKLEVIKKNEVVILEVPLKLPLDRLSYYNGASQVLRIEDTYLKFRKEDISRNGMDVYFSRSVNSVSGITNIWSARINNGMLELMCLVRGDVNMSGETANILFNKWLEV